MARGWIDVVVDELDQFSFENGNFGRTTRKGIREASSDIELDSRQGQDANGLDKFLIVLDRELGPHDGQVLVLFVLNHRQEFGLQPFASTTPRSKDLEYNQFVTVGFDKGFVLFLVQNGVHTIVAQRRKGGWW